jgi:hypothetical protein
MKKPKRKKKLKYSAIIFQQKGGELAPKDQKEFEKNITELVKRLNANEKLLK